MRIIFTKEEFEMIGAIKQLDIRCDYTCFKRIKIKVTNNNLIY